MWIKENLTVNEATDYAENNGYDSVMFRINLDLYRKAATSKDRVFTGKCDINGRKINVGDVIVPIGSTEQYCVNYSPTGRCFYGLGTGNKILKQKKFSQCENVGIAIFNDDVKEIFK